MRQKLWAQDFNVRIRTRLHSRCSGHGVRAGWRLRCGNLSFERRTLVGESACMGLEDINKGVEMTISEVEEVKGL